MSADTSISCLVNILIPTETPMTTRLSVANSTSRCRNCGTTTKFGQRSCCARGGAWFKECGDTGDTKFHHTWIEGIWACKDDIASSVQTPQQVLLSQVGVSVHSLNSVRSPNTAQQRKIRMNRRIGSTDSGGCVELTRVFVYICVSFYCICRVDDAPIAFPYYKL